MPQPAAVAYRPAAPPFNKPTADLVLRSSDNVDFRVRRAILAEASPIFDDMLSLPQPPVRTPDASSSSATEPPIVVLTESSRTLDHLLRFCYPIDNPELSTVEDVFAVLEASKKYLMDYVVREVHRGQFARHAMREPVRMYAIACRRGWGDEMRMTARASLAQPLADGNDLRELDQISAGAFIRLQAYHRACRKVAASLHYYGTDISRGPPGRRLWFARKSKKHANVHVEPWWTEYMERAREALQIRPCGATVMTPELSYKFILDVVAKLPLYERTRVLFDLAQFNIEFAESVDRAIAQVRHGCTRYDHR